jgi:hypothetical protein
MDIPKGPQKVKDSNGKEWTLKVTAGAILKACRGTGLSLNSLMTLDIDMEYLLAAIPFFCEQQVKDAGITHEDFLDLFGMEELMEVVLTFFPAMSQAFPEAEEASESGAEGDEGNVENLGPVTQS